MATKKSAYKQRSIFTPISSFIMNNMRISMIVMVGLILFGLFSYTTFLRREGFPSVAVPISVGGGQYFADDAATVDRDVSVPLTGVLENIEGVDSVTTFSNDNTFSFVADLDEGKIDLDTANSIVSQAIDESGVLPEGAQYQMVEIDAAKLLGEYDLLLSIYSRNGASDQELAAEAESLAASLTDLSLVSESKIEDQFTVNPLNENDRFKSNFSRAFDTTTGEFRNSVTIGVTGITGDEFDLFELDDQIAARLAEYNQNDRGFGVEQTADLTTSVEQDIASLQGNVITGAIVVTIISALLISWRVSVLTAFFIVAVLLVSVAALYVLGFTLNTITLFSLVLALGLFVDDATIIAEAIYAKRKKHKKAIDAVKAAINSIGTASFSGTLTTALVFSPLLFITGILGDFIFQMPMTVIISLIVSFILSITLIPLMANYTILRSKDKPTDRTGFLSERLASMIQLLNTQKRIGVLVGLGMVAMSIILLFVGFYFFGRLGNDIFPTGKDGNEIVVNINYPNGTTLEQAEAIADDVNVGVVEILGDNLVRGMFGTEVLADEELATIDAELIPYGDRDVTSVTLADQIAERFMDLEGAEVTAQTSAGGPPDVEFPFLSQMSVRGDIAESERLANDVLAFMQNLENEQPDGTIPNVVKSEIGYTQNVVRLDGTQFIELRAGFDVDGTTGLIDSYSDAVAAEFTPERLAEYGLGEGDLTFDLGQESDFAESFNALPIAALGALVVMYVLLGIQFRSLLKPVLILLALPFSFFGIGLGLFITNNPLSFFALIGIIGLIGIAVNNTILLVDNAAHHKKEGMGGIDAMAEAIRERFRPLTTTTLTTIAALLPLALTNPFWEALSFTIIFGLASSTLMVILAFPYYYLAADYLSERISRRKGVAVLLGIVGLIVIFSSL